MSSDQESKTGLIDRNRLPTDQFDWGIIKWLVAPNHPEGANMTLGEVVALPGQGHDRHNHPDAEEILYFLSGVAGQMVDDNEPYEVRAGDCVYIPKGVYHSTRNTGWEPLRVIAIYNPGGSEEAFRTLEDFRQVAPGEPPTFS